MVITLLYITLSSCVCEIMWNYGFSLCHVVNEHLWYVRTSQSVTSPAVHGNVSLNLFHPFILFLNFSEKKSYLTIIYHGHIWQASPQPSYVGIYKIWTWFKGSHRNIYKIQYDQRINQWFGALVSQKHRCGRIKGCGRLLIGSPCIAV